MLCVYVFSIRYHDAGNTDLMRGGFISASQNMLWKPVPLMMYVCDDFFVQRNLILPHDVLTLLKKLIHFATNSDIFESNRF
jgi:hypothetical protein